MARAGVPSLHSLGSSRVRMDVLEAGVRVLDPGSRALLDLSLRRGLRDDDMAPLLRIDAFNLAWRRARAIERLASSLGLDDPSGLAQVRAALPHLPEPAWCLPPLLEAGPPPAEDADPMTVDGEAITMEFEVIADDEESELAHAAPVEPEPERAPEHAWGPRALAVRPVAPARPPATATAALSPRLRGAVAAARAAAATRPAAARGALLAGAGALLGALLSRRRR